MRRLLAQILLVIGLLTLSTGLGAEPWRTTLYRIDANGVGESIGSITAQDTDQGLVIYPDLSGLSTRGTRLSSAQRRAAVRRANPPKAQLLPASPPEDTGIPDRVRTASRPLRQWSPRAT